MKDSFSKQPSGNSPIAATPNEKGFARIEMLLEATGGLSLSQVCAVTGLEDSTIQNWVKRGWVEHPVGKKYEEVHVARILIINALKECIKLEHIAKLMNYVNGDNDDEVVIKESTLYNYLCEALVQSGQSTDNSKSGIEAVIDNVIKDYNEQNPDARTRIRKALILMMFACVCTDVKRRTEAMMGAILKELEAPKIPPLPPVTEQLPIVPEPDSELVPAIPHEEKPLESVGDLIEKRKKVSQALSEWDISSVERVIIDHEEEARHSVKVEKEEKKPDKAPAPWYVRK